jgi:hypothetical protein
MKKNNSKVEKVEVDLDINEHLTMQEKGWKIQAVGMGCILVFILSAALGLYGDGIASKRYLSNDEVRIQFSRYFRFEAKMDFKIAANDVQDLTVAFPVKYLNHFEITSIVPQPRESRFSEDRVYYVFNGRDDAEITFYLIPQQIGLIQGSVKVNENEFAINHFIFP